MVAKIADALAAAMMYACWAMRHVDACGLLNRHWTRRLFGWAINHGTKP